MERSTSLLVGYIPARRRSQDARRPRHLQINVFALRVILGAALALGFIATQHVHAQTGQVATEKGVIREILDEKIYIEGETGMHVLETLGVCSWCEEGLSITIFFDTITKASIQPYPNPQRKKTVRAFILRDARLEF